MGLNEAEIVQSVLKDVENVQVLVLISHLCCLLYQKKKKKGNEIYDVIKITDALKISFNDASLFFAKKLEK